MGDSNQITVPTDQGDVVVHKMPLGDYGQILRVLDALPDTIKKFVGDKTEAELKAMTYTDLLDFLPTLLADSWPDVVALISVPTDKDADFLAKVDGPDAFDIIVAILQLNDFMRIAASIKKLQALKAKVKPATAPAPPTPPAPQS